MRTFAKILLISVCCITSFTFKHSPDYIFRRVQQPERDILAAPGINADVLFSNIWAIVVSSDLNADMLSKLYPTLSSLSFSPFADHVLTEAEYTEVVARTAEASGIEPGKLARYDSYFFNYKQLKVEQIFSIFGQEFTHAVNNDLCSAFKMVKTLYLSEYVAGQVGHGLAAHSETGISRRSVDLGFFGWVLSDGSIGLPWSQYIIQDNGDFILQNAEEVVSYVIVFLFDAVKNLIPDKVLGITLFNNICDVETLKQPMRNVKDRIATMDINDVLKQEILSYLQIP